MKDASNHLPLTGIRVLEIGQALAAPLAGVILADMGADVVKIEKINGGDDARHWGPPFASDGETSLYFHAQNRNKRSISLDLKASKDLGILHRLCESADILIQNLRPGAVERLGIDAETMCRRYPRLIYGNISSYGRKGPMRHEWGYDPLLQAYGGIMSMTGRPDEEPNFCGASINDKATGLFCTIGILGMLQKRHETGKGGTVDTSLFESAVHWVEAPLNTHLATGQVPTRTGTTGGVIVPYQVFHASDLPFVIAAGNDRFFNALAVALGHSEWAHDERFHTMGQRVVHRDVLIAAIETVVATRTRDDWIKVIRAAGVPCSPLNGIGELAATEQLQAVEIIQEVPDTGLMLVGLPIEFDQIRPRSARRAPHLGEHTDEILRELG